MLLDRTRSLRQPTGDAIEQARTHYARGVCRVCREEPSAQRSHWALKRLADARETVVRCRIQARADFLAFFRSAGVTVDEMANLPTYAYGIPFDHLRCTEEEWKSKRWLEPAWVLLSDARMPPSGDDVPSLAPAKRNAMARVLSVPHPEEDLSLAKAVWKTAEPSVEADGHVIADANALFQETWNPLYRALHARTEQEVIEACAARIQKHRELRQTARSVLEAVRNLFRDLLENAGLGNDEDALRYMYYWTSIDSSKKPA